MRTFSDLVQARFSCRNYLAKEVAEETLYELIQTAHYAPSAANFQPWHIIIIQQPESKEKVYSCYGREWFRTAPVVLIVCADMQTAWKRSDGKNHGDIDAAIFIDHFTLAAAEKGLATCWVCNFNATMCIELFHLPEHIKPVAFVPVGYPSISTSSQKTRKPLDEIIHWNGFK